MAIFGVGTATAEEIPGPLALTFEKTSVKDGVWEGRVSGDTRGRLRTVLRDVEVLGDIWLVKFDWIVKAKDEENRFTARMAGMLNTATGKVAMTGQVIEGYRLGAQVEEEGTLIDADTLSFKGTIEVHAEPTTSAGSSQGRVYGWE